MYFNTETLPMDDKSKRKNCSLEHLKDAVKKSASKAGVLKELGLKVAGGNYKTIDGLIKKYSLDTSHWTGQGHLKGKANKWAKIKFKVEELLTDNNTFQTFKLKQRLLKDGVIENKCYECGLTSWNNKSLNMHLDHINGKSDDHRLENLRMLCPNCHSQTETYCARNKKILFEINSEDIISIKNKTLSIKDACRKYKVSAKTLNNKLRESNVKDL